MEAPSPLVEAVNGARVGRALRRRVRATLGALLALDVTIAAVAFLAPSLWFALFHGTAYDDPQGFLRRCGANWGAFAVLQAIALARWERDPAWLLVVAGARLGDVLTDWTYLGFARDVTWFARVALFATSPANLAIGVFLVRAWRRIADTARSGRA